MNIWRHRTLLVNGGLVVVLAGAGVGSYLAIQPSSSGASVVTTTVQRGTVLATVSASGTVEPAQNLGLNFTTGGKLTNIYVKVGQHVHAGQKLAKVDPTASNESLTMAEAGLSAFQTCLKQHGEITPRTSFSPGASFSPRAFPSGTALPTALPSGGFRSGFPGGGAGANSAAFRACQKYAPAGFRLGTGVGISASAIAAFKSCMSQNGVTVTNTSFPALARLARSSKKAAAAFNTCRVLLQQGFASPSPTPAA